MISEKLGEKLPLLKDHEVSMLVEIVEKSSEKESIYSSLGISKPKKLKGNKVTTKNEPGRVDLKTFLNENFEIMLMKG